MKFVSVSANYSITIKPGIPREPLAGRPAVQGIYVRFEDHVANVSDPSIIEALTTAKEYGIDFTSADSASPEFSAPKDTKPVHFIQELDHGSVGATKNAPGVPVDIAAEIEKRALDIAKQLAPQIAVNMLKAIAKDKKEKDSVKTETNLQEEPKKKVKVPKKV